jgi:hypothetical protein
MATIDEHFSLEEWADFVREQTPEAPRARMREHLESGCGSCGNAAGLWRSVMRVVSRHGGAAAPDGETPFVKALYDAFPPQREGLRNVLFGRLASEPGPAPEGVRGETVSTCHFLFEEGNLLLDVNIESRIGSNRTTMIGQIIDSASKKRYQFRPVALMREHKAVARATTDEFGEFQLEYMANPDLLLMIEFEEEAYFVLQLPALSEG